MRSFYPKSQLSNFQPFPPDINQLFYVCFGIFFIFCSFVPWPLVIALIIGWCFSVTAGPPQRCMMADQSTLYGPLWAAQPIQLFRALLLNVFVVHLKCGVRATYCSSYSLDLCNPCARIVHSAARGSEVGRHKMQGYEGWLHTFSLFVHLYHTYAMSRSWDRKI